IGLTVDAFCDEMSGGWLFGYVDALARFDVETVIVCFSRGVDAPTRRVHAPTGAPIWLLPAPRLHRAARRGGRRLARTTRVPPPVQSAAELGRMYSATSVRALTRVLREERCRVVFCQEYEYARFDVARLAGRLAKLPIVATFQGGPPRQGVMS